MKRETYEKTCDASRIGVDRFVENLENHQIGQIVSCRLDQFEVDVYGKRSLWPKESCEERKEESLILPR